MIKAPKLYVQPPPPPQKHHPNIDSKHFNQNEIPKKEKEKQQNKIKLLTQTDSNFTFRIPTET